MEGGVMSHKFRNGDKVILIDYTFDDEYSKDALDEWVKNMGLVHKVVNVYGDGTMSLDVRGDDSETWRVNQSDCILADENNISFYEWKYS
jgi:hypothetical protein